MQHSAKGQDVSEVQLNEFSLVRQKVSTFRWKCPRYQPSKPVNNEGKKQLSVRTKRFQKCSIQSSEFSERINLVQCQKQEISEHSESACTEISEAVWQSKFRAVFGVANIRIFREETEARE